MKVCVFRFQLRIRGSSNLIDPGLSLDLNLIDAKTFLLPFLDIIRAEDTSVLVTTLALSTVQKIINYRILGKRSSREKKPVAHRS